VSISLSFPRPLSFETPSIRIPIPFPLPYFPTITNLFTSFLPSAPSPRRLQEQKDLQQLMPENRIMDWFVQIGMALRYLHGRNILHRDIKTQNIFLTRHNIVKVRSRPRLKCRESESALPTLKPETHPPPPPILPQIGDLGIARVLSSEGDMATTVRSVTALRWPLLT
jgi:serine/threonine protein kinase